MIEFFQWIDSLPDEMAWLLLASIAFVMAIVPFLGTIWRAIYVLFSNEKTGVHDFSWRFIPNRKMADDGERKLYVTPSERPVIYEGMVIMLTWNVGGAFRTDVLPVKKRMKGNVAFVPVRKGRNVFTLVAYTWKGKIRKELVIEAASVRNLSTLNLSKETFFGQPAQQLTSTRWSLQRFAGKLYSRLSLAKQHSILTKCLWFTVRPLKSITTGVLTYQAALKAERKDVIKRAEDQVLVKTYTFNPKPYNRAIHEFKQEQHEII
jgi:hypothetical protein